VAISSASSRLLRSERGKFQDVTAALAPGFDRPGLVTSAVWSDVDNDRWIDLLVTHEWGPVKLFRNQKTQFVDSTRQAGLADLLVGGTASPWRISTTTATWTPCVTNLGLNTATAPSVRHRPSRSWRLRRVGQAQLVEAGWDGDRLVPLRSLNALSVALPSLAGLVQFCRTSPALPSRTS